MESIQVSIRTKVHSLGGINTVRPASACSSRQSPHKALNSFRLVTSKYNFENKATYTNSSQDPYKKKLRLDFQIFSSVKKKKKIFKKNAYETPTSEHKNRIKRPDSATPARFFRISKIQENLKSKNTEFSIPKFKSDLKLLKDFNTKSVYKTFEMEKTYQLYLKNYQAVSVKDNDLELISTPIKSKQVTFNLE